MAWPGKYNGVKSTAAFLGREETKHFGVLRSATAKGPEMNRYPCRKIFATRQSSTKACNGSPEGGWGQFASGFCAAGVFRSDGLGTGPFPKERPPTVYYLILDNSTSWGRKTALPNSQEIFPTWQ